MGTYTHFGDLEVKYRALAGAAAGRYASPRARKSFISLRKALVLVRVKVAVLALKAAQEVLREKIYERYIPSRAEYASLSKTGGKEGAKQAKARGKLQRAHAGKEGPLRQMQPTAANRAWERTGRLSGSEKVATGEDAQGDFIVLRNDAANKRGSLYAVPRKDLGTAGHRKNSAWTQSLNWQMEAFMLVRRVWLQMLHDAIQKVMNQ